jgi:hypothetical protein
MGKLKNLLIETEEERELFNRIERESKQRKEAVLQALHDENERLGLYKDAYGEKPVAMTELMDELAVARVLIRELGDRLATLEGERNFCPRCGKRLVDGSIHTCTPPQEKNT